MTAVEGSIALSLVYEWLCNSHTYSTYCTNSPSCSTHFFIFSFEWCVLYTNIHNLYLILIQPQCSILYNFNSTMNVLISGFLDMSDETFKIFNRTIKLEIHCSHISLCTDVIKNSWSINKLLHFFFPVQAIGYEPQDMRQAWQADRRSHYTLFLLVIYLICLKAKKKKMEKPYFRFQVLQTWVLKW